MQKWNLRMKSSWYLRRLTLKVSLSPPLTACLSHGCFLFIYLFISFLCQQAGSPCFCTHHITVVDMALNFHGTDSVLVLDGFPEPCPPVSDYFPKRQWIWLSWHSFQIGSFWVRGPVLTTQLWLNWARSCDRKQPFRLLLQWGCSWAGISIREHGMGLCYTLETNSEKIGLNSIEERGMSLYNVCLSGLL